jgi:hypothetical protein
MLLLRIGRGQLLLREASSGLVCQRWGRQGILYFHTRGNLLILSSRVRFSMKCLRVRGLTLRI